MSNAASRYTVGSRTVMVALAACRAAASDVVTTSPFFRCTCRGVSPVFVRPDGPPYASEVGSRCRGEIFLRVLPMRCCR